MSDIIHLLPDSVANQIAAGEVIQRPASVVKELVENAIDAGATQIQIVVKDAGRTMIQVIDNGKGMSPTDARLSFERHATSKIQCANDLFNLTTMGFRGEALASIASVAQVELRTRTEESETGTLIEMEGVFKNQETISCPQGTSFTVSNLFFNVPARRKFLKSNATELRHITETFQRIALTYPEIAFTLTHNGSELFHLLPTNYRQRIVQIFGKKINQQLLAVEVKTALVNISGFVGNADSAGKSAPQYFFVNGRYMRHPYFHKAIMEAYARILPPDQTSAYFIYFDVNPNAIDINVHPTKTEIKFQDEREIFQILMVCVKEALGKFNVSPAIDFDTEGQVNFPINDTTSHLPTSLNIGKSDTSYNPFAQQNYHKQSISQSWEKLYGSKHAYTPAEQTVTLQHETRYQPEPHQEELFENTTPQINRYFQYKNKYIFTAVKSGIMLIHQQRAHTQILFEKILAQIETQNSYSQQLLFPEKLELLPNENMTLCEIEAQLKLLGFDIACLGQNTFAVNGIPAILTNNNVETCIKELIQCAAEHDNNINPNSLNEQLAYSLAKSVAIPSNKPLCEEEMNDLIDQLFSCRNHQFSYNGKPIITIIENCELERKFSE